MPDNTVWPPKPDLPDPLTEHDEVIAAKLATLSATKTGPNRILLIKALRDEEGMELQQAFDLSKSYCDRHGLFVTGRVTLALSFGGCGLFVAVLCLVAFSGYLVEFRRDAVLRQPHHHAALMALDRQEIAVVAVMIVLMLCFVATVIITQARSRVKR